MGGQSQLTGRLKQLLARAARPLRSPRTAAPVELSVLDAYALWAPTYAAEAHNPFMDLEQASLFELLPELAGAVVVDLACGTGRYASIARARGAAAVIGVDLSQHMLRGARRVTASLARGDLTALPLRSGVAGVVICGLAVGHVRHLERAIAEMGRVMAPNGTLVYSDFHPAAHAAGRRRNFEVEGRSYAVEHHPRLPADHRAACRAAGLDVEAVREPTTRDGSRVPAVLVIRARKR
jgi:malonyl-CoA O-methyltransferase